LGKVIKGCTAGQSVRLLSNSKETRIAVALRGNFVEQTIPTLDVKEWPPLIKVESESIALDEAFKQALREAFDCAGTDPARPVLHGACLDVSNTEAHYVVGANGTQLYAANSFLFDIPENTIVPTRRFLTWPGFINDGPWKLSLRPKENDAGPWFQIASDHWTYVSQPVEGTYPNWKSVVPTPHEGWTKVVLGPKAVDTLLDAVPLLPGADQLNESITLQIGAGQLFLKAKGKGQPDWTIVPIADVQITGNEVETSINRGFLLKALRFGTTEAHIKNPVEPMLFRCKGKVLVVMPLRGDAAEKYLAANPPSAGNSNNSEIASAASAPSAAEVQPRTEPEPSTMATNTMTPPARGNLTTHPSEDAQPALQAVIDRIEKIKTTLRDVLSEINDVLPPLKQALKEKKATEKEVAAIRSKLRSLQSVEI
jgi:DNA polymerase III sliding clamp (beta) subunit (PCNA family)